MFSLVFPEGKDFLGGWKILATKPRSTGVVPEPRPLEASKRKRDKGGFEQLGVSQEVSGGVVGYSFKLFVGFRLIEILGLTFLGIEREGACLNEVWARVLGLPMHLWGKDFFKRLDDACGGFIMVNMEIEERCHNPNSGQPMTLTVKGLTVRINLNLSWQSTSRP
ncbi:hypothetical protein CK203_102443 [Vitis vinifera]|uniref:Uncharacterized protein n=1 Tax=Vitis vinifera TaxID=29760 RepID=A0A438CIM2_VITVI|nr:hypothetical protein CK203_102443 [Vitis vinifera]